MDFMVFFCKSAKFDLREICITLESTKINYRSILSKSLFSTVSILKATIIILSIF